MCFGEFRWEGTQDIIGMKRADLLMWFKFWTNLQLYLGESNKLEILSKLHESAIQYTGCRADLIGRMSTISLLVVLPILTNTI